LDEFAAMSARGSTSSPTSNPRESTALSRTRVGSVARGSSGMECSARQSAPGAQSVAIRAPSPA
jgi:hypothetical protein